MNKRPQSVEGAYGAHGADDAYGAYGAGGADGARRKQGDAGYARAGGHPEARIASGVLSGLRRDLFSHPFAFRPLPPLDADRVAGWVPWMPPRTSRYLRWFPHALVLGYAFVLLMFATQAISVGPPLIVLIFGVLVAGPPAMTLVRPVGAFWVSLLAVCFGILGGGGGAWPLSVMGHLATMTLVVLRTRPRLAPEMWAVTFAVLMPGAVVLGSDTGLLPQVALANGVVLLAAAAVRAWREERQQVEETRTVTAVERSRRTTLEERATIARELHDVVAHHMSVIAIQAEAAPYRVRDTPPELATAFSTIRENAVAALTELRRILGVVRSEDPDAFVGPEAPQPTLADLDGLLDSVRGAGLSVTAVVTGAVRQLPQGVELSAYRIIQEALSNTLRHAPGAEAQVEVAYVLGGLGLRVVNGPANRLAKPSPGAGHGVLGMHERVGMLNGEMTNGPTADGGYEVAVFLPAASTPDNPDTPAPGASRTTAASSTPGTSGATGASRTTGTSGATGASRTTGTSGATGASRTTGTSGAAAASGATGASGTIGVSEAAGASGASGGIGTSDGHGSPGGRPIPGTKEPSPTRPMRYPTTGQQPTDAQLTDSLPTNSPSADAQSTDAQPTVSLNMPDTSPERPQE